MLSSSRRMKTKQRCAGLFISHQGDRMAPSGRSQKGVKSHYFSPFVQKKNFFFWILFHKKSELAASGHSAGAHAKKNPAINDAAVND